MAADTSSMAVNGNYGAVNGQSYDTTEHHYEAQASNHVMSAQNDYATTNLSTGSTNTHAQDVSKEEVGWYFVEQYYTTLSKNPDKLFLFYTKQSQFVSGNETEKVSVCVGQKAISEKIKSLHIQDCKVRVTNVDSQGSRSNIVIQVIGEISNKSQPRRKFTQTFVLAEQANGYYVLNDIFRYILDEDEYEPEGEEAPQETRVEEAAGGYQEPATTAEETAPAGLTTSDDPIAQEHDAAIVDRSLEEAAQTEPAAVAAASNGVNGDVAAPVADVAMADDTPVAAANDVAESSTIPEVTEAAPEVQMAETEKPSEPEPTPAASPPKVAAQPAVPSKPAAPRSWANLVAGPKGRTIPAVAAAAPAPVTTKQPSPAAPTQPAATPTGPAAYTAPQESEAATPTSSGSEWQTAGHDHKRQQSRAQGVQTPVDNSRGYIKNVTETIELNDLKEALDKIAKVTYFDVSRPKKCAFVDFSTAADYSAAVAASPIEVNGQRLYVEERRIRPPGPGANFNPRGRGGPMRGGRGFPGRGNFRGGRGGPQAA